MTEQLKNHPESPNVLNSKCLDGTLISMLVEQHSDVETMEWAESHLDTCGICRRRLAAALRSGVTASSARSKPIKPFSQGSTLGRYVVLETVAMGSMGIVYAAYDPQLDRKVALKLLRLDTKLNPTKIEERRERLLREARAMARLTHNNVIGVHDVGTIEGQLFIAMEFIEGGTLSTWLRDESRSWRQIVEKFDMAGRGLAAAHAAGSVHRDFKPDNVLVGTDESVRVGDFGLVSIVGESDSLDELSDDTVLHNAAGDVSLTRTGTVVGTIRFMAPESLLGQEANAQSDQFSFCVALFHALYGTFPFAGDRYDTLRKSVLAGEIQGLPKESSVPPRIHKVLVRGLGRKPCERYPSMEDLLVELADKKGSKEKRFGGVIGALAILAVLGLWLFSGSEKSALCQNSGKELIGVWDEDAKVQIGKAFAKTGRSYAEYTAEEVAKFFDTQSSNWAAMKEQTCRATHVSGTQSEHLLDLRMACLGQRLSEMRAIVGVLVQEGDEPEVLDRALRTVHGMGSIEYCADVDALLQSVSLPVNPLIRKRVAEVREKLSEVFALYNAGKYAEGVAIYQSIDDEIQELDFEAVRAESLLYRGSIASAMGEYDTAQELIAASIQSAALAKHDRLSTNAWFETVNIFLRKAEYKEALNLQPIVQAAISRSGNLAKHQVRSLTIFAHVKFALGDYSAAQSDLERALKMQLLNFGDSLLNVNSIVILGNLGSVFHKQRKFKKAHEYFARGLRASKARYGSEHPNIARILNNIGLCLKGQSKYVEAESYLQRSIEMKISMLGEEHSDVGMGLINIGLLQYEQGNVEKAEQTFLRGLRILEAVWGPDHVKVGIGYLNLGRVYVRQKKFMQALELFDKSMQIMRKKYGENHVDVGEVLSLIAVVNSELGHYDLALEYYEKSLQVYKDTIGTQNVAFARILNNLGDFYVNQKREEKALPLFQQAIDIQKDTVGVQNNLYAMAMSNKGDVLANRGEWDSALSIQEESLKVFESIWGKTHGYLARPLNSIGTISIAKRQYERAQSVLERSLEIQRNSEEGQVEEFAATNFLLAQALWHQKEQGLAREKARQALLEYAQVEPVPTKEMAKVRKWLSRHK